MRNMCRFALVIAVLASGWWACGSSGRKPADAGVDAFFSICGNPGDPGNADGVGKFCTSGSDCGGGAPLCTVINPNQKTSPTFFCTKICTAGSAGDCGSDATCECQGECACTPNQCLGSD